jgi:hypothetical protein
MTGFSRSALLAGVAVLALALGGCSRSGQTSAALKAPQLADTAVAAVPENAFPDQVYWGDTHLHTMNSTDAILFGSRLTPEDALRFARGEKVRSSTGIDAQLERPLDFLVVSDHSEGIGTGRELFNGNPAFMADPTLKRWHDLMLGSAGDQETAARELIGAFTHQKLPAPLLNLGNVIRIGSSTWEQQLATVERYNTPGRFTAFIGYEYTSTPKGNNLHRIVIFRDGADKVGRIQPFSSISSPNPEKLWAFLSNYEQTTGGKVLAIPHNGDLSNGLMFALTDFEGAPLTSDYARRRARWEPLTEVTQIKGDSESHPYLSPDDEFADFGKAGFDQGNLDLSTRKTKDMLAGDYAREALKRGLMLQQKLGTNPFKFGMIGATDNHTALSSAGEKGYMGDDAGVEPGAARASHRQPNAESGLERMGWQFLSGGYTAVWATANTRGAIWDGMMRKEVYGTTGTRLKLRLFGGWDFAAKDLKGNFVQAGYSRGVPMGGDLPAARHKGPPTLMVNVLKDPLGANLDRIQIVKGWVDKDGQTHEHVYNVAWSDPDKRKLDGKGKLPPVGDTVDLAHATYANSIGAAQLSTVWKDPDFDPSVRAFYYVRALEIPTPRWPVYDAVRYGAKLPADARLKDQQRGYSSPIWYDPKA